MRTSQLLLPTLRQTPADAEIASHRLMLRAGLIRRVAAGVYTWLPAGLRVLRKVEAIVREEMDRAGAQELLMTVVQPAELWEESGRWVDMGPDMFRLYDRHERAFALGPTHEEVITDLVRREVRSYRQLPCNLYQIQTKFRDEVRPRYGVMRGREFIMKDAYSFHLEQESLDATYQAMHRCYARILERMALEFRAVLADTGAMGGSQSHEFQVLAESGEDRIALSDTGSYAANVELAEAVPPSTPRPEPGEALTEVATPGVRSIAEVAELLDVDVKRTVKTLVVAGSGGPVLLVLRGDHELNETKASKLPGVEAPLRFAEAAEIRAATGCGPGSLGPVGSPLPTYVDHAAAALADFVCGANRDGYHLTGTNWERDVVIDGERLQIRDLRNVEAGDPSPDGHGYITIRRGIEVGHIFQLGTKYSEALEAIVQDADGTPKPLIMGCYGMGITRLVAAIIEQCHDERGILWPLPVAPWRVVVVPINAHKSESVRDAAERLYAELSASGLEPLLDDREERPGVKFTDMELLGIPHRVVVSERGLGERRVEYRARDDSESADVPVDEIAEFLRTRAA